jgi:hypothetical protein
VRGGRIESERLLSNSANRRVGGLRHQRPRFVAGIAAVLCAITSVAGLYSDDTRPLTVNVTVERGKNSFVSRLGSDAVDVLVNGTPHPIESVAPAGDSASIVLLVDLSFSSTWGRGRELKASPGIARHDFPGLVHAIERLFVPALRPGDRLSVGGFSGEQMLFSEAFLSGPQDQLAALDAVVGRLARELQSRWRSARPLTPPSPLRTIPDADWTGASPIWDAVVSTASLLALQPPPRAIVLVTDGQATGNRWSMADAALEAAARGVAVHVVYQPEWWGDRPNPHVDGDRFLRPLAAWTGGVFRVNDGVARGGWRDAPPPFTDLVAAIHHTHAIRLNVSAESAEPQSLEVRVKQPGLRVHAPKWVVLR